MIASSDDLLGRVLKDTYRLERLIGEGGMGVVYEAGHLRLARRFAVKLLRSRDEEALRRFRREAEIIGRLGHPHIVEVIDFDRTDQGIPYLVMELLAGEPLAARLQRTGPLSLEEAGIIFEQVASALQATHRGGVVHRDLKPENIFVCQDAERTDFVKVVDFGISKLVGATISLTTSTELLGTPAYMAPEQAAQQAADADHRLDVYALGTILYEMLAGAPAFEGSSPLTVMYRIVHEEPRPLLERRPELPPAVVAVVARAMAKRPQDRFASMADFAAAFRVAQQGRPERSQARAAAAGEPAAPDPAHLGAMTGPGDLADPAVTGPGPQAGTRIRRWLPLAAAALVGAVGLASGLAFWSTERSTAAGSFGKPDALPPPRVRPRVVAIDPDRGPAAQRLVAPPDAGAGKIGRGAGRPGPGRPGTLKVGVATSKEPISPAVFLDGAQVCYAPCELLSVAPGPHLVEGLLRGYHQAAVRINIRSGKTTTVLLKLQRRR